MRVLVLKRKFLILAAAVAVIAIAGINAGIHFWPGASHTAAPADVNPIYQGSSEKKEMALTCNVFWGEEYLPEMLSILEKHDVPVTFFIGGTWAEKNRDLTRSIYEKGHEIGNHGYSHPHPDRLSPENNLQDIKKCENVLEEITGKKPYLYAPPYGERGPSVLQAAERAGYVTILWSIDTVDWKKPGPEKIYDRVTSKAHNGAIVLMHPTESTVKALPGIIEYLQEKGYTFVSVSQLIKDHKDNYIK